MKNTIFRHTFKITVLTGSLLAAVGLSAHAEMSLDGPIYKKPLLIDEPRTRILGEITVPPVAEDKTSLPDLLSWIVLEPVIDYPDREPYESAPLYIKGVPSGSITTMDASRDNTQPSHVRNEWRSSQSSRQASAAWALQASMADEQMALRQDMIHARSSFDFDITNPGGNYPPIDDIPDYKVIPEPSANLLLLLFLPFLRRSRPGNG